MNILKFKSNRDKDSYKISLQVKNFIDKWTKQKFLINVIKNLSFITKIPSKIIDDDIKQNLSSNFLFSRGQFSKKLSLKYLIIDAPIYLLVLIFCILFSKKKFKPKNYNIIVDDIDTENHAERFLKMSRLVNNTVIISKKKINLKRKNLDKLNLINNSFFKLYNKNFLIGKRFKLFILFFIILFSSLKHKINLFFIFKVLLYKIINYETLFQTVKSKILIIDRFYKTSAIKNFIFKKHGGKITSCTQKNICEFTISFFVNTDVLFSLGTRPPTLINKLGGKIKKFIPVGSLPMEHFWYNYWSKKKEGLKKIPEYDIMIVGLNYANAPDRMYIDKKHYSYYYEHIKWIKKISLLYPKKKIVLHHHPGYMGNPVENEMLKDSKVIIKIEPADINSGYAYLYKAKKIFSFGSTMILEALSLKKNSYFLDPGLQNISFHKSIPKAKKIRLKSFKEFEKKIIYTHKNSNEIKNTDFLCLKSNKVTEKILNFYRKNNYLT